MTVFLEMRWCNMIIYCGTAGAYDNRIVMWDVGGVDSHYAFKVK